MFLVTRLSRLVRDYRQASAKYRVGFWSLIRRAAVLLHKRGLRPRESLDAGLLDPAAPESAVADCVGHGRIAWIQRRVNPVERECLIRDKATFYLHARSLGLRVPRLYAVFGQLGGFTGEGQPLRGKDAWRRFLDGDLPPEFVLKPAHGREGLGVRVFRRVDGAFVDHESQRFTSADLYEALIGNERFRKFVLQERLVPHSELARLSGTTAVQTVRVVTYVDSGAPAVWHASLRIIAGKGVVDNYQEGRTGNLSAGVDLRTGRIGPAWTRAREGSGLTRIPAHPVTGVPFAGFTVPFWGEIVELVRRASSLFLPTRCLGWDVAPTESGPVLLETNMYWGPANIPAIDLPLEVGRAGPDILERLAAEARRGPVDAQS